METIEHAAGLELARKLCAVENQRDELLAALRDLCDAIPDATVAADPPLGHWVNSARAAIAKAEG